MKTSPLYITYSCFRFKTLTLYPEDWVCRANGWGQAMYCKNKIIQTKNPEGYKICVKRFLNEINCIPWNI